MVKSLGIFIALTFTNSRGRLLKAKVREQHSSHYLIPSPLEPWSNFLMFPFVQAMFPRHAVWLWRALWTLLGSSSLEGKLKHVSIAFLCLWSILFDTQSSFAAQQGHEGAGAYSNETFIFRTDSLSWTKMVTQEPNRYCWDDLSHWVQNISLTSFSAGIAYRSLSGRGWLAGECIDTGGIEPAIVLFGGFDGERRLNDVHLWYWIAEWEYVVTSLCSLLLLLNNLSIPHRFNSIQYSCLCFNQWIHCL